MGLLENGDIVAIDAEKGTLDVELSDDELAARKAKWQPRSHDYQSGAIWRYAATVGPAYLGAVTHPGGKAETHVYADRSEEHTSELQSLMRNSYAVLGLKQKNHYE